MPADYRWHTRPVSESILVIACGALAQEITALKRASGWDHLHLKCLDARLHNRPAEIPRRLGDAIRRYRDDYAEIFVAYADCGTGGMLDRALEGSGVERIPGAHCYEFFAGSEVFHDLADEEPGSFYLTDFLVRHFDRLVWKGLGLDRQPDLSDIYFSNYKRVVYIAQTESTKLQGMAVEQAQRLGLDYEYCFRGDQPFSTLLQPALGE